MSVLFVAKSGNDSNSGLSLAQAKLTIGGAVATAATGDVIQVYRGRYNESVYLPTNTKQNLSLKAVGHVLLDGGGLLANGVYLPMADTAYGFQEIVGFEIARFTSRGVVLQQIGNGSGNHEQRIKNCRIHHCANGIGSHSLVDGGSPGHNLRLEGSIIHDCTTGIYTADLSGGFGVQDQLYRNTIANNGVGFRNHTRRYSVWRDNIFQDNGTSVIENNITPNGKLGGTGESDYNSYFGGTHLWGCGAAGFKDSLAAIQALMAGTGYPDSAISGKEANGKVADAVFVDAAARLYGLRSGSPLLAAGSTGNYVGARGQALFAMSNAYSAEDWAGGVFTNTQLDGSGRIVLSAGQAVGTWASPVKDLGELNVLRLAASDLAGNEVEPTDVFDSSNSDTAPNRKTFEFRASMSSFAANAASPAWVEVEVGSEPPVIAGRFVQVRITLRQDGVVG